MATTRKKSKKTTKKVAKKKPVKRAKAAPIALTSSERARKLKPRREYPALVETFLRIWEENPDVRLTSLTRAQLESALTRALKAASKEDALRRQYETVRRALGDARLIAEDIVWRKLLDANAMIKAQTRVDPRIGEAFAFLGDALRAEREPVVEPEPEPAVG